MAEDEHGNLLLDQEESDGNSGDVLENQEAPYDIEHASQIINAEIEQQMSSRISPAYMIIAGLCFFSQVVEPSHAVLLIFSGAPDRAFDYNPHAKNAQTIISEWDLTGGTRGWIPGLLQSLYYVGFLFGALAFGQLSDRFGRKSVAWKGQVLMLLIQIFTGFCQNWQQLGACRALIGFLAGVSVVKATFMQELCGNRLWAFNGVVSGVAYVVNMFLYIFFAYYFPSWRSLHFVTAIPGFLGLIYYIVAPESPRWLVTQGRAVEALAVVNKLRNWNGKPRHNIQFVNNLVNNEKPRRYMLLDLVRLSRFRTRTLIMGLQWFTASIVYHSMNLGSGIFSRNFYFAYVLSTLIELPSVPMMFLMDSERFGRKYTLVGCSFVTASMAFVVYICPYSKVLPSYEVGMLLVGKFAITTSFNLIYIYTPELYPTVVRNLAMGTMSSSARIGGIMAPYLANTMLTSASHTPYILHGILCILCSVVALQLPETRGNDIINT